MGIVKRLYFALRMVLAGSGVIIHVLVLPLWIGAVCIRLIVELFAKMVRADLDGILKPRNSLMAMDLFRKRPTFNITIVSFFSNDIEIEFFRGIVLKRVFSGLVTKPVGFEYERLRQSVTRFCGYFFWKRQSTFDIRDYVGLYEDMVGEGEAPSRDFPVREEYGPDDLKEIVGVLGRKPWKKNRGAWEFILVRNYRPAGRSPGERQTVVICRVHHSLGDGYSVLNLLALVVGYEGKMAAEPKFKKPSGLLEKLVLPFKALLDITLEVADVLKLDWNGWVNHPHKPSEITFQSTWTEPISTDRIKKLKGKFGVGYFCILQGICGGAMRKMMIEGGVRVPREVTCVVPVPLAKHRGGLRIHVGGALVKLYTGEGDGVKRVLKSMKNVQRKSGSLAPMMMAKLYAAYGYLPSIVFRWAVFPGMTVGLTCFPAMESQLELTATNLCNECFFTVGVPPTCTTAAILTTLSQSGNIIFTMTCRDKVCESRKLLDQFNTFVEEEIEILEAAPVRKPGSVCIV